MKIIIKNKYIKQLIESGQLVDLRPYLAEKPLHGFYCTRVVFEQVLTPPKHPTCANETIQSRLSDLFIRYREDGHFYAGFYDSNGKVKRYDFETWQDDNRQYLPIQSIWLDYEREEFEAKEIDEEAE